MQRSSVSVRNQVSSRSLQSAKEHSSPHIPALDGIRAIAILFVLLLHFSTVFDEAPYNSPGLPKIVFGILGFGWSGVDLFFALSGFLITGILIDSKNDGNYFGRFYWRRALRIFPVYYLFLFLIFGVLRHLISPDPWVDVNIAWYLSYLSNWSPGHGSQDKLIGHIWSLAVEEQFYLVWPAVVYLVPSRFLAWACALLALAALAIRLALLSQGADWEAMYRLTPARMDALLLGALMAIAIRDSARCSAFGRVARPAMVISAVIYVAVILITRTANYANPLMITLGISALAVGYSFWVFQIAQRSPDVGNRFLISKPLRSIGRYSYTMYLIHLPLHRILYIPVKTWLKGQPDWMIWLSNIVYIVGIGFVVYILAWISWRVIESPILSLKSRVPRATRASS